MVGAGSGIGCGLPAVSLRVVRATECLIERSAGKGVVIDDDKKPPIRFSRAGHPAPRWWLVTEKKPCTEALLVNGAEQPILPVFSSEDEAEMFAWLGSAFERGWRVREMSGGELISLLRGSCADVESVALDPCPEMVAAGSVGLVSVSRERFISWIVERSTPLPSGGRTHYRDRAR